MDAAPHIRSYGDTGNKYRLLYILQDVQRAALLPMDTETYLIHTPVFQADNFHPQLLETSYDLSNIFAIFFQYR